MNKVAALTPEALLEALLFVAQEPVEKATFCSLLELTEAEGEVVLAQLEKRLTSGGLRLQRLDSRVQLVSAPAAAPYVEDFLGLEVTLRLSQAAMEALAIIAYLQPTTRPRVEAVRGVSSGSVIRTLLSAGLVAEAGRADTVGRPILYRTTFEFLQQFGLENVDDLPSLEPGKAEKVK
ncbi:MAG TPA: SMC-Scp complex subunit ScpB [Thermoflexia bacterium]|nr:SMC-Scp complex subunit ScpB [Thermoflexia bacterium]